MFRRACLLAALFALAPATARAATFTVNKTTDSVDAGDCATVCSLRDAVTAANASGDADSIVLPASSYAVSGTLGPLTITGPVTISSPTSAVLTSDNLSRVFDVNVNASPPNDQVTISHLTISGGSSPDNNGGGAVLMHAGSLTLDHDVLTGQTTNERGGAIETVGGATAITDSEVVNGHAFQGGGVDIESGSVSVLRSLFSGNDALTGGGAAIYNRIGFLDVQDSTFVANTAGSSRGGAIFASASTTIRNSTFEGNTATSGSAIYSQTHPTLINDLFGPPGAGANCGVENATFGFSDQGGNLETGTSCGFAADHSNQAILLGPLTDNGGPTLSLLPWHGSPGVDAGTTPCTATDQRGTARTDGHCDVGALEGASDAGVPAPTVSNGEVSHTTPTSTLIDAEIDRQGVPATYAVLYGKTTGYGDSLTPVQATFGTDDGPQSNSIYLSNLQPGTLYHYRVDATSAGGTTRGLDATFKTPAAPTVTTNAATSVTATGATLNGTVNPAGGDTLYLFEWGPDTGYGFASDAEDAGAGTSDVPVSASISGLDPGATVHYRLVAYQDDVEYDGADMVLTTPGPRTYRVTSRDDHAPDACDSECTIRDAVTAADADGNADVVEIPEGTYTVTEGPLLVSTPMTIEGPSAARPAAKLDFSSSSRDFEVTADATISYLSVHGGTDRGAGVYVHGNPTVTLDHDVFDAQSTNLQGGAMWLDGGLLNITDTAVTNATAAAGGALYLQAGTANVERSLFFANGHNNGGGGAIYNDHAVLNVDNSTFAGNEIDGGHGGAIYSNGATTIASSTFDGNIASGDGGGGSAIWADRAVTLANDLFGPDGDGDNCAGTAPSELGGSVDAGATCHASASNQTILLGPLTANGGATATMLPWHGSAGVDAGDDAVCPAEDQRDFERGDGHCDAGAVEGVADAGPPAPTATLGDGTTAGETSASIESSVDRQGVGTEIVVHYGLTPDVSDTTSPQDAVFGNDDGPQDNPLFVGGLVPGKLYYYKVTVSSAGGSNTTPLATFTTAVAPTVVTGEASAITNTSATVTGTIDPSTEDTNYWFEYGPTDAYGSSTDEQMLPAGGGRRQVSATLADLEPGVPVHFRLVATHDEPSGDIRGADMTFTPGAQPTPTPTPTETPTPTPTATPTATPTPTPQPTVSPTPTPTPAVTPTPTPTPQFEKTVVVAPVSGSVLVQLPGTHTFVALKTLDDLPNGTTVDTRHGKIELSTVSRTGQKQSAQFYDGLFTVTQGAATTDLKLTEPLAACPKHGRAAAAAKKPKSRRLWGDGSGSFRTEGKYSAATVRGTRWLVQDSCQGTLTQVKQGVVAVRDNVKRRTILVRAGQKYLARPKRH